MRGLLLFVFCLSFTFLSIDSFGANRNSKKSKSNVYIGKKYKGHSCPKPRKIINAKYF